LAGRVETDVQADTHVRVILNPIEAQFDFDSNPNDIADGATAIPPNFIVDGRVKGYLVNENRQRVTPIVIAICRIRR
jgi:hypothetical protein